MKPGDRIWTTWVTEITGLWFNKKNNHRENCVSLKSLHANMNGDVSTSLSSAPMDRVSERLQSGDEFHTLTRLLDSCHHKLITDFLLSHCMKNCIRCAWINTHHPHVYNYVLNFSTSITCPGSDLHAKGYMAWSHRLPPRNFNYVTHLGWVEWSTDPFSDNATFYRPPSALQSSMMQIGSDRAIAKPIRQRKGVEQLGQDQWRSQDGSRNRNTWCTTACITFRSPSIQRYPRETKDNQKD